MQPSPWPPNDAWGAVPAARDAWTMRVPGSGTSPWAAAATPSAPAAQQLTLLQPPRASDDGWGAHAAAALGAGGGWGAAALGGAADAGEAGASGWLPSASTTSAASAAPPVHLTELLLSQQSPRPAHLERPGQLFPMMADVAVVQRFWRSLQPVMECMEAWTPPPGWAAPLVAPPAVFRVCHDALRLSLGGADVDAELAPVDGGAGCCDDGGFHYLCAGCQLDASDDSALLAHMHGDRRHTSVHCVKCNAFFPTQDAYQLHIDTSPEHDVLGPLLQSKTKGGRKAHRMYG